jgi:hypothetical protein
LITWIRTLKSSWDITYIFGPIKGNLKIFETIHRQAEERLILPFEASNKRRVNEQEKKFSGAKDPG